MKKGAQVRAQVTDCNDVLHGISCLKVMPNGTNALMEAAIGALCLKQLYAERDELGLSLPLSITEVTRTIFRLRARFVSVERLMSHVEKAPRADTDPRYRGFRERQCRRSALSAS